MSRYAEGTSVPVDRSRAEIERTLTRYGADAFMYGQDRTAAVVQFDMGGYRIRFRLTMPDPDDHKFTRTPGAAPPSRPGPRGNRAAGSHGGPSRS